MPGPGGGGGGRGGSFGGGHGGGGHGGGRGGSFGGGPRPGGGFGGGPRPGGGFGGGPHPGGPGGFHHRPPRGPRFWGPGFHRPYYGGGGGCLGGIIGAIIAPIILILFMAIWLMAMIPSCSFGEVTIDNTPEYNANVIGDFADKQYAMAFGQTKDYEDHLLLLFLTDEDCSDYYYVAWVGDHIVSDVADMFGDNQTELGRALLSSINEESYKYSLDRNLATVFTHMSNVISDLDNEYNHICEDPDHSVTSHVVNRTDLPITEQTVNEALENFTKETDIPVVVVIEDMDDVLGSTGGSTTSFTSVIKVVIPILIIAAVIIFLVVRAKKEKRPGGTV